MKFFDADIFSLELTTKTKEKYGGEMRSVNSNLGRLLKADKSYHTFCEAKDIGHLYLNVEFLASQNILFDIDYLKLLAHRGVYSLVRFESPAIDSGYVAPLGASKYNEFPDVEETKVDKIE